jgi:hypothetical protein
VDCVAQGVATKRPAPHGGPRSARCATHWREFRKRRKTRAHELHVEKNFGLTAAERKAILDSQDGVCFVCRRTRDDRKRHLATDHDHDKCADHAPEIGCRNCVRCLACLTCNRVILGRYDVEALKRAIAVLTDPPAQKVLNPR